MVSETANDHVLSRERCIYVLQSRAEKSKGGSVRRIRKDQRSQKPRHLQGSRGILRLRDRAGEAQREQSNGGVEAGEQSGALGSEHSQAEREDSGGAEHRPPVAAPKGSNCDANPPPQQRARACGSGYHDRSTSRGPTILRRENSDAGAPSEPVRALSCTPANRESSWSSTGPIGCENNPRSHPPPAGSPGASSGY